VPCRVPSRTRGSRHCSIVRWLTVTNFIRFLDKYKETCQPNNEGEFVCWKEITCKIVEVDTDIINVKCQVVDWKHGCRGFVHNGICNGCHKSTSGFLAYGFCILVQDRVTDRKLTIKVSAKGGISFFGMSAEEMKTKTRMEMHDAIENIQEIPVTIKLRVLYRPQEDEFSISAYSASFDGPRA